jgi:HD superfamily phosphohydrolase
MFEKLPRKKVFRDPLYGYITVEYKLISDLIDTLEIQRLRRISQLSGVSRVFQTAEHSRFTHALGAYQMANLVITNVDGMETVSEYEKVVFLCAALLHDIGHGPYSHAFESVTTTPHEEMTVNIILSEKTDVNKVLSICSTLASDVAGVISHSGKYPLIESLVSSQLDVDRMDYLSRDAYFTGAEYGHIDYYRILRSMKIVNNQVVVKASGVHSVESYLMSRYHMYFQVYYHPVSKRFECLLEGIYARIKDLYEQGVKLDADVESLINVINDSNDIESYINLDDTYVNGFIKTLTKSKDQILSKLCMAFERRHLFEFIDLAFEEGDEKVNQIRQKYDNEYKKYLYQEVKVSGSAYNGSNLENIGIKMLMPNGNIVPLDTFSPIIKSLVPSSYKTIERIYYFED